jgi:hypothetical protein
MPFKHHASRRHHIPKARYRIRNWAAYEAGLRRRGDLTLWIDETAIAGWQAERRTTPGGQPRYSDLAIDLVLTLRLVFHLALRQAEGLVASVLRFLHLDLAVPDHSTLSRRGRKFADWKPTVAAAEARHIVIDSTGLQVFGYGAWHGETYGYSRRSWRKLHLAVDADSGEIVASTLTDNGCDDAGELPFLLARVEHPIRSVTADGAYDDEAVYRAAEAKQPRSPPDVVIPPRSSAVASRHGTQRDQHITTIAKHGRMAWQKMTGYGRRNAVETAIGRYKTLIGPRLRARNWRAQRAEAACAIDVLNCMIRTAKPVSVRVS